MSALVYLPLVIVFFLVVLPFLTPLSSALRQRVNGVALLIFGSYVAEETRLKQKRMQTMRAARMNELYRVYAAQTLLYTTFGALAATVLGPYLVAGFLRLLALPQETLDSTLPEQFAFMVGNVGLADTPDPSVLFVIFLLSAATFGFLGGIVVYLYRWHKPRQYARTREPLIDESLPRTVAFMFALSRSGMSHDEIIEIISQHERYFGEAASEFVAAHRDMEVSGVDFLTATRDLGRTSPSDEFANFAEDLTSVLRTGRSMSEFLREEYEKYQQEKEQRQEQVLEDISALAEGYVALLVAGPLFLITILVVIGIIMGGTLLVLRFIVYLLLPMATIGFLYYLGSITRRMGIDIRVKNLESSLVRGAGADTANDSEHDDSTRRHTETESTSHPVTADGGYERDHANHERLQTFNRIRWLRDIVANPVRSLLSSPVILFYGMVPVGIVYVLIQLYLQYTTGPFTIVAIDDYVVHAALLVLGPFALVQYFHDNRQDDIEKSFPDFVERISDSTGAGMTLTRSIQNLNDESIPGLRRYVRHLSADIALGTRLSAALVRFAKKTQSVAISRATILMINAKNASNDVTPVLRIVADEARLDRNLNRQRRQELFIYQLIIYISFFIFLGIVGALVLLFIPGIPSEVGTPEVGSGNGAQDPTGVSGIGGTIIGEDAEVDRDAYELILFHAMLIQSVLAGLVAGKMSEGSVKSGAKHAFVLLLLGYLAVLFIG